MDSPSWTRLLLIVLLLAVSAFFSACETALSKTSKVRLRRLAEDGNAKAAKALTLLEQYDKTLFAVSIGSNMANISATVLATLLFLQLAPHYAGWWAGAAMLLLVFIFCEVLPKAYARDHPKSTLVALAGTLDLFVWVLTPLILLFSLLQKNLARFFTSPDQRPSYTEDELHYIIETIEEEGVLEDQERELVQSALDFDETTIQDILTPRVNISAIDIASNLEQIKALVIEEGYSRIPVFEGTIDNIVGILYSWEFLVSLVEQRDPDLPNLLREPLFVHRTMNLSNMLASFKTHQTNIAVVTDDYGGVLGIVTMEDVLEELVGDIWDEDDEIPTDFLQLGEHHYEVGGDYDLEDLLERFQLDAQDFSEEYTTVNGWALHILDHIPKEGESFTVHELEFTVLKMDGQRIETLAIHRNTPSDAADADLGDDH